MRKPFSLLTVILAGGTAAFSVASAAAQPPLFADPAAREKAAADFLKREEAARAEAMRLLGDAGLGARLALPSGETAVLRGIRAGVPLYDAPDNVNAAISSNAASVRRTAPYSVSGGGVRAGLWEAGGIPRATHQEFDGAGLVVIDTTGSVSNHATHVAGTMMAQGVDSNALGMAPDLEVDAYTSSNDIAEMALAGAALPQLPGTIDVSNHSYGLITGWDDTTIEGTEYPAWYGTWGQAEAAFFGQYGPEAAAWDFVVHSAPYYLPFKSAGNDRNDAAPSGGATFVYFDPSPQFGTFDPQVHPGQDGGADGYDSMSTRGTAKNIVTVGSALDAVNNEGQRDTDFATVNSFSNWGPTDDGRIKPDLVANGNGLYSSGSASDNAYSNLSGTSMSTPNASGSAALLVELHRSLTAQSMLASTLKGLLLHTATDMGNPGPDYSYGWGYMDTLYAAETIFNRANHPDARFISEGVLTRQRPTQAFEFEWNGAEPIRATLCWTDPAAPATENLDDPALRLVNDLDLRITSPSGTVYQPFVLDPSNPSANATRGDNFRDNVEQVLVENPAETGTWILSVTMADDTDDPELQAYSLVLTGQETTACNPLVFPSALTNLHPGADTVPVSIETAAGCAWTVTETAPWLSVSPTSGTGPATLTLSVTENPGQSRTAFIDIAGNTFQVTQNAPADNCSAEVPVFLNQTVRGNTRLYGTNDGETIGNCGGTNAAPDHWYKFVAPCAGETTISLGGSNFDTVLGVYSSCDPGTLLFCNDDAPGLGFLSRLTFSAVEGATYYIKIDGYNDQAGSYALTVTQPDCDPGKTTLWTVE